MSLLTVAKERCTDRVFGEREKNSFCCFARQKRLKFRLKLKNVRKTTRSFRSDLDQVPYDYTVEVTNRFKGLDLIECMKNCGWRFITLYRRQWLRKRKAKCLLRRPYK